MTKRPDSWEDPPEDELTEVPCDGVGDFDRFFEIEIEDGPIEDRDCDYWNRTT